MRVDGRARDAEPVGDLADGQRPARVSVRCQVGRDRLKFGSENVCDARRNQLDRSLVQHRLW
jgi:hypothetical protein